MMCQACGKRQATTHLKRTVNGQTSEWHLCAECAAKQGINLMGGMGMSVGNLFGGLFGEPLLRETGETTRCEHCGKSFREIVESGQVGCPDCYITFYEQLQPTVQRIHGKAVHAGKIPSGGTEQSKTAHRLEQLKEELNKAITEQAYERCAELRDQIRELEANDHE
jgi:protein arginine kinase activator